MVRRTALAVNRRQARRAEDTGASSSALQQLRRGDDRPCSSELTPTMTRLDSASHVVASTRRRRRRSRELLYLASLLLWDAEGRRWWATATRTSPAFHRSPLPRRRPRRDGAGGRSLLPVQQQQQPRRPRHLEAETAAAELPSTAATPARSEPAAETLARRGARRPPPPPGSTAPAAAASSPSSWFPTRIQDALDGRRGGRGARGGDDSGEDDGPSSPSQSSYRSLVRRMYLRHVAVETREMADVAVSLYQRLLLHPEDEGKGDAREGDDGLKARSSGTGSSLVADPFGRVAELLSADSTTAAGAGTVGWVDLTDSGGTAAPARVASISSSSGPISPAFTPDFIRQIVSRRPKAGDVVVLQDEASGRWHAVLVAELWLRPRWISLDSNDNNTVTPESGIDIKIDSNAVVGAFRGQNRVLSRANQRFRGQGVRPEAPEALRTYRIQTAGCQMNVADSERLEGVLAHDLNLRPHDGPNENVLEPADSEGSVRDGSEGRAESLAWPDVVVLNTCSIRDKAEQKVYNALGPYCAAKRQGRRMVVVVTGCVAQQEGQDLLARAPEVDAVVGPQYIPFLKNVIDLVSSGQQVVATSPMMIAEQDMNVPPVRGHDVRAWVNVIYGCNEHCTYCVVPATRGTEQSRSMEAILAECVDLASRGYKEITLIGQNIDAYGRDMVPKRTFADLLTFLNGRLPNPMRIRYVTSHPRYFGQRVIDAVASLDKVCECFHMPFQAGDDEVLRRMRRGYTSDSYLRIIHRIRETAPDASITTDIIVGFPGETEEAFQKTLQLMDAVKFDNVNSFAYSPRPNTEAALWTDQMVSEEVKADRLQRVQKLAAEHGMERSLRYVGRTEEVLVEDGNPRNPLQVMGRTRQGRQVYFDGDLALLRGQFVKVLITEARTWSLLGNSIA